MKDATTSSTSCKTTDDLKRGDVFRHPGGQETIWLCIGDMRAVQLTNGAVGSEATVLLGREVEILEGAEIRGRWR